MGSERVRGELATKPPPFWILNRITSWLQFKSQDIPSVPVTTLVVVTNKCENSRVQPNRSWFLTHQAVQGGHFRRVVNFPSHEESRTQALPMQWSPLPPFLRTLSSSAFSDGRGQGAWRRHSPDQIPRPQSDIHHTWAKETRGSPYWEDCYMQSLLGSYFQGVHTLEGRTQILRDSEPHLLWAQTYRDEVHKANYSRVPSQFPGQCLKFYSLLFRLGLWLPVLRQMCFQLFSYLYREQLSAPYFIEEIGRVKRGMRRWELQGMEGRRRTRRRTVESLPLKPVARALGPLEMLSSLVKLQTNSDLGYEKWSS